MPASKKAASKKPHPEKRAAGPDFLADTDGGAAPVRLVNLALDATKRPLAGADIITYVEQHRLERLQVVEQLAMASPGTFAKLVKTKEAELPFQVELLLRFYQKQPVSRRRLLPIDVFNAIYGPHLRQFKPENADAAKIMLYERFSAMLGRTVYSAYRWFKRNDTNNFGVANGPLRRLFAQLPEDPDLMREELEDLARTAYRVRGQDFEELFPMPNPLSPPVSRRPSVAAKKAAKPRPPKPSGYSSVVKSPLGTGGPAKKVQSKRRSAPQE